MPLKFSDAKLLATTLQEIRADTSDADGAGSGGGAEWCVFAYAARNCVEFVAKGAGGIDGLVEAVSAETAAGRERLRGAIHYVYVKLQRGEGMRRETRFCLYTCVPQGVSSMGKAVVVPHKGAITAIFSPFTAHAEISGVAELTQEAVEREAKFYVDWRS